MFYSLEFLHFIGGKMDENWSIHNSIFSSDIVGGNIIATTKIQNNYSAIQFPILR